MEEKKQPDTSEAQVKELKKEPKENKGARKEVPDSKTKKLEAQIKDLTDTLQRVQADFENYKKRVLRENQDYKEVIIQHIIVKLLPLLDSFSLALQHKDSKEMVKGVELIYAQFIDTLEKQGLKAIVTTNKSFDPYKHEALMAEQSDKPSGTILEEFQKGYLLGDKVIRHSKVKVSK